MSEQSSTQQKQNTLSAILRFDPATGLSVEPIGDTTPHQIADLVAMAHMQSTAARLEGLEKSVTQLSTALRQTVELVKNTIAAPTNDTPTSDDLPQGE